MDHNTRNESSAQLTSDETANKVGFDFTPRLVGGVLLIEVFGSEVFLMVLEGTNGMQDSTWGCQHFENQKSLVSSILRIKLSFLTI